LVHTIEDIQLCDYVFPPFPLGHLAKCLAYPIPQKERRCARDTVSDGTIYFTPYVRRSGEVWFLAFGEEA
jgi:hypothetical protein